MINTVYNMDFKRNISISVVIPVYNNEDSLHALHGRLCDVLGNMNADYELLFVDDCSKDDSWEVLKKLYHKEKRVKVVKLTRNFGQANAIAAGLDLAGGEVVVVMDADLQDKPEDIPLLIEAMEKSNCPMAVAKSCKRKDSFFRKIASRIFSTVSSKVTDLRYEPGLRIFRAMRREVIERLKANPGSTGTALSLIHWMGIDYSVVDLQRDARYAGKSGYTLSKMVKMFFERIFTYSLLPIRLSGILGFSLCLGSFIFALCILLMPLFEKELEIRLLLGLTSLFLFGLVFIFLGIIGEYIGMIYSEVRNRPRYVIAEIYKHEE